MPQPGKIGRLSRRVEPEGADEPSTDRSLFHIHAHPYGDCGWNLSKKMQGRDLRARAAIESRIGASWTGGPKRIRKLEPQTVKLRESRMVVARSGYLSGSPIGA